MTKISGYPGLDAKSITPAKSAHCCFGTRQLKRGDENSAEKELHLRHPKAFALAGRVENVPLVS